jgi:hypothetical protein
VLPFDLIKGELLGIGKAGIPLIDAGRPVEKSA